MEKRCLAMIMRDGWLEPVADKIKEREDRVDARLDDIKARFGSLSAYADSYKFFGFNRDEQKKGWWFREWAPGAHDVYICGDFNNWHKSSIRLTKGDGGVWSYFFDDEMWGDKLVHGSLYKIVVNGDNGMHERLPAYTFRAIEEPISHDFSAQLWAPEPFDWEGDNFDPATVGSPIIYECHVGMAQEQERVGLYRKFTRDILPRVKRLGYNTIQLMAIAEHPYYGSFGYHVSNFFAPSSRFGTPEELKQLIREAHKLGIAVIMDLVHAHYVKNFNEGLNELDGTNYHYSKPGEAGRQPYWDSMTFDYGKHEVERFLLSNVKYWIEEYHFDGFRFDGVTSMLYHHHGYVDFGDYDSFFGGGVNEEAITYLTLANKLVHDIKPTAITIAEDVSGMPGITVPFSEGGVGFDYRLAMSIPDYWIKLLEDVPDEEWDMWEMWHALSNRLPWVKTIAYAESHDQALVGDKTIAFRLMDKEMYYSMHRGNNNPVIDRGIAIHKMIRLITATVTAQGYLCFMGNEFGHPEWIDFPREGNGFSYEHARRQWSLVADENLLFIDLERFDRAMVDLLKKHNLLDNDYAWLHKVDIDNKTIVYSHKKLLFVFNWHVNKSIPDYEVPVPFDGVYRLVLNSDDKQFAGHDRLEQGQRFFSYRGDDDKPHIKIYNINRAALVFELEE